MRLLLDQGLPRSTVVFLKNEGIEALRVGEVGMASASDPQILDFARRGSRVVITLDADFHALLALSGARQPSVIRIRMEGFQAQDLAELLSHVLSTCDDALQKGAMVTVSERGIRVRRLPLLP